MSLVVFRYENNKQFKKNGVGYTLKESIIEGDRGLSFSLTKKEGNNFYRISARETSKDMFNIREKKGDNETSIDKGLADVKKMISENKDLLFIKNYIEKERGTYKGKEKKTISGGAKKSKKSSKTTSVKKSSNKKLILEGVKKNSKKSSKTTSVKKLSKKKKVMSGGAKKKSKKISVKKASKKRSVKKASKK